MNLSYLNTYSDKLIFDSYNRSFFAEGKAFGNHFVGSYHGEVFNDFEHNIAYADYSSVHGHHNIVQNESEAAFGKYNDSIKDKTIFSVGYGSDSNRSNIFELQNDGTAYVKTDIYSNDISFNDAYSYLKTAYSYSLTYSQNLGNKLDSAYSYLTNAYSYTLGYATQLGKKYDNAYSYFENAYSYTLGYATQLGEKYDNAYSYFENAYSYIYKNYPSVIPNENYSKLYIWTGTSAELPAVENRFKNVIYIVTNEQETELPEYVG